MTRHDPVRSPNCDDDLVEVTGMLLLVEDDDVDAERVERLIQRSEYLALGVMRVRSLAEAVALLDERRSCGKNDPRVILSDLSLPDATEVEAVRILREACPSAPLIVQTGDEDPRTPADALGCGAQDYLCKGTLNLDLLERAIRYSLIRASTARALGRETSARIETDGELDEFAHVVAHDLRAPVRTARLFADRLLHELSSDDPLVLMYGERLDESLERVDRMILSMLEYAALRGEQPPNERVSVHEVFTDVCRMAAGDLDDAMCQVVVDVEPSIAVIANRELLTRVGLNLVANAVKYRRLDVPLAIMVTAGVEGARSWIRVADNGIGVPAEARDRVFQILERLDTEEAVRGLGFGLAICRRIISKFGGTIHIEPSSGPGTTVFIELPRHR